MLEILAKDKDSYVRASVTENPITSKETLELLAKDENRNVRALVAQNPIAKI